MSDWRISKVEAATVIPGVAGKRIGPGQRVDMDEVVGDGKRVRDLFPEEWFDVDATSARFDKSELPPDAAGE
jgi:hypothetical protein